MKTFTVTSVWSVMGNQEIEAETVEEAQEKAKAAPLPLNGTYLEDSFQIDEIEEKT